MTVEFHIGVEDGKPIRLIEFEAEPNHPPTGSVSYWALSAAAYGEYPDVLIHVYYRGELPNDAGRDRVNAAIKDLVGRRLGGQQGFIMAGKPGL